MGSFAARNVLAESQAVHVPVQIDGEVWGSLPKSLRIGPSAPKVAR